MIQKLDLQSPSAETAEHLSCYKNLRVVPGNGLCALQHYLFTCAIVTGINAHGDYERRYCFEHERDAAESFSSWNGVEHPSGPWIKLKGLGVDMLNPNFGPEEESIPRQRR